MLETSATWRRRVPKGFLVAGITTALALAAVGCRNGQEGQQAPIVDGNAATDPAMANMADPNAAPAPYVQQGSMQAVAPQAGSAATVARMTYPRTRVAAQVYQNQDGAYGENYTAQPPSPQNESGNYQYQQPYAANGSVQDDQLYAELLDPNTPEAQQPPPPLPAYEQPPAPGPDYLWTPGYWDYATTGYYYVPGNWVAAPFVGALWTPGWWGYQGRGYRWHRGYWGPHVGYYGGVNYGFGFIGIGYQGGYWNHDHFFYNTDVTHVRPAVVNNYVYNRRLTVVNNTYINNTRVSYVGGPGGLERRPNPAEFAAVRETRMQPLPGQVSARQAASQNRAQFFADNHGRPNMLFASNPVAQQRNVAVPQQLQHLQSNPEAFQQRVQAEQQRVQQQQQHPQFQGNQQQQRLQADQQRQQQNQAFRGNEQQQRVQADQQRQQQNQALRANEQQQRVQADQQRQQQVANQRQQSNQEHQQAINQQHQQAQMQQQRQQADQPRRQFDQQRQQQAQQQRQQQSQQRAQVEQQRPQQAQHQAPVQHAEQPHGAPAQHVEAPHGDPGSHGGGHGR